MGAFSRIKASAAWRRPLIKFRCAAEVRNKYFPATPCTRSCNALLSTGTTSPHPYPQPWKELHMLKGSTCTVRERKNPFTLNAFIQTLRVTTGHTTCHLHSIIVTADSMNEALPSHNKAFKIKKVDVLLYESHYVITYMIIPMRPNVLFLHVINPWYTRTYLASASGSSLYCRDVIMSLRKGQL